MENTDKERSTKIAAPMQVVTHRFLSAWSLAVALWIAGGVVLRAQAAPPPPPAPQAAQDPSEPPDAPEPPEPPAPPEPGGGAQIFVLNDGSTHLGVALIDVTPQKAEELKLPAIAGAIVTSVQKGSAAATAGVEKGDVILEFDGIRVRSSAELRRLIRETPSGRTVEIKIVRDEKTRALTAKLEASSGQFSYNMPEIRIPPMNFRIPKAYIPPMDFDGFSSSPEWQRVTLGISGDDLTRQLAQFFGIKQGKGVLVSEVTLGGAADKAGLKAGDVITQVDGLPVSGVEELRHTLNDNFTGDTRRVRLTIVRDHHELTLSAELNRTRPLEKRTSSAPPPDSELDLRQLPAQLGELRAHATQLHALADTQRALIQSEVLQQQKYLKGEWQQQLQQQMRSLKDQLQQMRNFHLALHHDDEI